MYQLVVANHFIDVVDVCSHAINMFMGARKVNMMATFCLEYSSRKSVQFRPKKKTMLSSECRHFQV